MAGSAAVEGSEVLITDLMVLSNFKFTSFILFPCKHLVKIPSLKGDREAYLKKKKKKDKNECGEIEADVCTAVGIKSRPKLINKKYV